MVWGEVRGVSERRVGKMGGKEPCPPVWERMEGKGGAEKTHLKPKKLLVR